MFSFCVGHSGFDGSIVSFDGGPYRICVRMFGSTLALSVGSVEIPGPQPSYEVVEAALPDWRAVVVLEERRPLRVFVSELDETGHLLEIQRLPLQLLSLQETSFAGSEWGQANAYREGALDRAIFDAWNVARSFWTTWEDASQRVLGPKLAKITRIDRVSQPTVHEA